MGLLTWILISVTISYVVGLVSRKVIHEDSKG
jgi:hypothetical protein